MRKTISVFMFLAIFLVLLFPATSYAFVIPGFGGAFGGRTYSVTYCTCSLPFSILLSPVGPPRGGSFMYQPGISTLYMFYSVFSAGPWVLGTSSGNAICKIYSGNSCIVRGSGPIIRKIGTSLW